MPKTPKCAECGDILEQTGRLTWYCPSCDTCEECGCPQADNFSHYAGCTLLDTDDEKEAA